VWIAPSPDGTFEQAASSASKKSKPMTIRMKYFYEGSAKELHKHTYVRSLKALVKQIYLCYLPT
jgi:hypothetical protein